MSINGFDHVAIITGDAISTAEFYSFTLGLDSGPRPNFNAAGVWLYCKNSPVLHIVEVHRAPATRGSVDHVAFNASGLESFTSRLIARGIAYDLRRLPEGLPCGGAWQLFFDDPNAVRIEVVFPASERPPDGPDTEN
jgi:catechol 2,3-dioxygenase-like lactoylglutathione lyase family enzyme